MPRLKLFLLFFIISKCFIPSGNAQTAISGIINSYSEVTSVVDANDIVISNASDFNAGDTVLLIQVKGIEIIVSDNAEEFGMSQNVYGAGKYEFLLINNIDQGTGEVNFTSDMSNFGDYDAGGSLQLVRVPGYDNARVIDTLTCQPWDSTTGTGGVLAMIVGNTLTLEADIDVTGKGLKGGMAAQGAGVCVGNSTSVYFEEDSDSAGYKGEGAASYAWDNSSPLGMAYKKGRGPLFNGGGGGNGKYSGGAGGANYGSGGDGGKESKSCGNYNIGGIGGRDVKSFELFIAKRIFMGGGGGSATQNSDDDATDGGNGGGIIIIVADTLVGNGNSIKVGGADVTGVANANGGAGGGGAGGTVLLEVNGFKGSSLNVDVKGGNGGDSGADFASCTGPGGGGGGGAFWYSLAALPPEVSVDTSGGVVGNSICFIWGAQPGNTGGTISGLRVPLSGFLFNSIFSFNTGADHDTICESGTPPKMLGTAPKGGTPDYEYRWESSEDKTTWMVEVDWPTGNRDYYPVYQLFDTIYYRRLVRDQSDPQILDISKILTIIVQPKLENNSITADQTICESDIPLPFTGSEPTGGDVTYTFSWEQSEDNIAYIAGIETDNTRDYTPGALIDTTYYRRIVTSSVCADTSGFITTNVEPALANYGIQTVSGASDTICSGQVPNPVTPEFTSPIGGNGVYTYYWEKSIDGIDFNPADGVNNVAVYSPPTLTATTYFRRTVYSGQCQEVSDTITITVLPLISNNTLPSDIIICSGTNISLTGSTPAGGAGEGSYIYFWEESADSLVWSPASEDNDQKNYTTPDLISPIYYRRTVVSGFGDCCQDISSSVFVDIYPLPGATITSIDTAICDGSSAKLTLNLTGASPWNLTYNDGYSDTSITISGTPKTEKVSPAATGEFTSYSYTIVDIIDGNDCIADPADLTGLAKVRVDGVPVADAGVDDEVCGLTYTLQAVTGSFGTGVWTLPLSIATDIDADDPNKVVTASRNDTITYTWTVTNGVCTPKSNSVTIIFWEPPSVGNAGQDQNLEPYTNETELKASFLGPLIGNILWTTTGGATIQSPNDSVTKVINLDLLENIFTLTVSNSICPDNIDNVKVFVPGYFFVPPKGISPTITPGQNDFFRVKGVENVENELIIFSRWGQVILNVKNFMHQGILSQGWDGTDKSGNQLPDDTYYYILKIKGEHPQTLSGFIVIKGVSK